MPEAVRKLLFQLSLVGIEAEASYQSSQELHDGSVRFLWNVVAPGVSIQVNLTERMPVMFYCRAMNEYQSCGSSEQAVMFVQRFNHRPYEQQRLELD